MDSKPKWQGTINSNLCIFLLYCFTLKKSAVQKHFYPWIEESFID